MTAWIGHHAALGELARRGLFFIGGPPRSGTTWVQRIADAHPLISCRGEGLFSKHLADPIDALYGAYGAGLREKNQTLAHYTGGYPAPEPVEADVLVGAAVLLALRRQGIPPGVTTVGEKTPENVFLFPRLKRLFPQARFVGIARDPRDVVASAWRVFGQVGAGADEAAAKAAFVAAALPQISAGLKAMIALEARYGADCLMLTYEALLSDPAAGAAALFRFLGAPASPELVAACVEATRAPAADGDAEGGRTFIRRGANGEDAASLTPALRALAVRETGWAFERFGWRV
jgi:hypothetical protein